jgi:hypothetical protein
MGMPFRHCTAAAGQKSLADFSQSQAKTKVVLSQQI